MKLEQQCSVCRSYSWCGRTCKMAPRTEAAAHTAATIAAMAPKAPEKSAKASRAKKPRVDTPKPNGRPTPVAGDSEKGFDRNVYHKAYMREYMRKKRAKG